MLRRELHLCGKRESQLCFGAQRDKSLWIFERLQSSAIQCESCAMQMKSSDVAANAALCRWIRRWLIGGRNGTRLVRPMRTQARRLSVKSDLLPPDLQVSSLMTQVELARLASKTMVKVMVETMWKSATQEEHKFTSRTCRSQSADPHSRKNSTNIASLLHLAKVACQPFAHTRPSRCSLGRKKNCLLLNLRPWLSATRKKKK